MMPCFGLEDGRF